MTLEFKEDAYLLDLAFWIQRWRRYPLAFVMEACQARKYGLPNHQQVKILDACGKYRKVSVCSGHGIGKTRLAAWEVWRHMICFKRAGIPLKVPIISPTDDANSDVIWSELSVVRQHLLPFLGASFEKNKSGIYSADADEADFWFATPRTAAKGHGGTIRGYHGTVKYVFDEASVIEEDEIFESAMGALTGTGDSCLIFSNPTRISGFFFELNQKRESPFHRLYFNALDNRAEDNYSYSYALPNGDIEIITCPGQVTDESINYWRVEYGEGSPQWSCRVLGQFPRTMDDQLIRKEWIDAAWERMEPVKQEFTMV